MSVIEKLKEKSIRILGALAILAVIAINHNDCITITKWVLSFLDHVVELNLKNYALDYMESGEFFTNYSLFTISVLGVWCLPIYLIGKLMVLPFVVYTTWVKILMGLLAFINTRLLFDICENYYLRISKTKMQILFLLSPIILIYSIGMGQIDGIALFFLLLGLSFFQKKEYVKMAIFLGLSMLIKGFSVFAILVILAYLMGQNIKNIIYGIVIGVIFVAEKIVSQILVKDYLVFGNIVNERSFLSRIFEYRWNMITPCVGIVVMIAFFAYYHAKEKNELYCMNICSVMYMSFFFFFDWSPQYLYYMLPFAIIGYVQLRGGSEKSWLWWGGNVALLLYGLLHFNYGYINGLLFSESLVGKVLGWKDHFISNTLDVGNFQYLGMAAKTIWFACAFFMIIQLSLKETKKDA